jgi:uncharacterized protein (TIGR03437 family)
MFGNITLIPAVRVAPSILTLALVGLSPALGARESSVSAPALPLVFEQNLGQEASQARYLSHGRGFDLGITEHGWTLRTGDSRLTLSLQGAGCTRIEGVGPLTARVNYLVGKDPSQWHVDVPTVAKVRCAQVSRGLDLVYYPHGRDLEYDLVAAAGATSSDLSFDLDGAQTLRVDGAGDLLIGLERGELRMKRPLAYQGRSHVAARYVVTGNRSVRIALSGYDPSRRLVIDPVLDVSTLLGGAGNDKANGVATDEDGNIYVAGQTFSLDFPIKGGFQSVAPVGCGFVAKLNPSGHDLVWSTYLCGSGVFADSVNGIAVDPERNVYVARTTYSLDFPVTPGAFQTQLGFTPYPGASVGFVAKLSPRGNALRYSTLLGGDLPDEILALAVDEQGNASVAGATFGTQFPLRNPVQSTQNGLINAFVSKVNATGSDLLFSTYLGGRAEDYAEGIAVDRTGNTIITGLTYSTDFPTHHAFQSQIRSGPVFRSSNGGTDWSTINKGMVPTVPADLLTQSPVTVESLAIDPSDPSTVYAGTWSGLFRSTDRGETWAPKLTGIPTQAVFTLAADPISSGTVYAGTLRQDPAGPDGHVYKSKDRGESWVEADNGLPLRPITMLRIDPLNPANLYAVADLSTFRTGLHTQMFKTTDGAGTWNVIGNGFPANAFILDFAISQTNPSLLFASVLLPSRGAYGSDVYVSRDGGLTWLPTGKIAPDVLIIPGPLDVDPQNPDHVLVGTTRGLYESTDGGLSWQASGEGLGQAAISALRFDPSDPGRMFAASEPDGSGFSTIWRSPDVWHSPGTGAFWTPLSLASPRIRALAIDPTDDRFIYAGTAVEGSSWVTKLSPTGELAYSTVLGGSNIQEAHAVAADRFGNAYVAGYTYSTDFPVSREAFQRQKARGGDDAFVTKLSPAGDVAYSTYLGAIGYESAAAIVADEDGRAYVAGGTNSSSNFPLVNPVQHAPAHDLMIGAPPPPPPTHPAGSPPYPYLAARSSTDFAPTTDPLHRWRADALSPGTGSETGGAFGFKPLDAFVSELSPDGTRLEFSTVLDGNDRVGNSEVTALALGRAGELYVAGSSNAHDFPTTPGAFSSQLNGSVGSGPFVNYSPDAFIAKLVPSRGLQIAFSGVQNDASRAAFGLLAPGELITIAADHTGRSGDDGLEDVQVLLNGAPVPLVHVGAHSVTAQVPFNTALDKYANLMLRVGGERSNNLLLPLMPTSPGIYTVNRSGTGQAVAFNEDGSVNSASNPAARGSPVRINLTGAGVPNPAWVRAGVGERPAAVTALGPASGQPAGVAQLTIRVADDAMVGSAVPIWILLNDVSAQMGTTIAVK